MSETREIDDFFSEDQEYVEEISEAKKEAEELRSKVCAVLGDGDGKEVADYIIYVLCGLRNSCFDKDALVMARKTGAQDVGRTLEAILKSGG